MIKEYNIITDKSNVSSLTSGVFSFYQILKNKHVINGIEWLLKHVQSVVNLGKCI